jgi:aspartyl/glutamyl-tRNA(Asn/Gln) amidotransferase C subunit
MSVSKDEVLKIARLAELHVDEAALPALVEQMSRILDYVAQIATVKGIDTAQAIVPGPEAAPLRADEVRPAPLAFGPAEMAPAFRDGFFLVPRLGAFESAPDAAADDE